MSKRILDKYELLEKVGEGGMAEVYRGRHMALGREVAVKLLHPHLSNTDRNRLRFEREAKAIESLQHEGIPRIYDYSGLESDVCYIVTEFIRGSTLKDILIENEKLPSEVVAIIGIRLCEALSFAHDRGIVHRDIKPENVMIREDGAVKLMDFGIARVIDESSMTLTGGLVGSPAYMSPEQASDKPIDTRSDIFSLGAMLYRTVTGYLPFSGSNTPVILRNIIELNYADPQDVEPGIAPQMAEIIKRALKIEADERFPTAADMEKALRAFLAESGIQPDRSEILRYLEGPRAYQEWLINHLSVRLTEEGKKLIAKGNTVGAMKLCNRVLHLDEGNSEVLELIQSLHKTKRPVSRYALASFFVILIPIAALMILGINHRRAWFGSDAGPDSAGASAKSVETLPAEKGVEALQSPSHSETGSNEKKAAKDSTSEGPEQVRGEGTATGEEGGDARVGEAENAEKSAGLGLPPGSAAMNAGEAVNPKEAASRKAEKDSRQPDRRMASVPPPSVAESRVVPTQIIQKKTGDEGRSSGRTPAKGRVQRIGKDRGSQSKKNPAGKLSGQHSKNGRNLAELQPALVQIRANPYANILINGKDYGDTVQRTAPIQLPPGTYSLRLENPFCQVLEKQLVLSEGQIFSQMYDLKPLPAMLYMKNLEPGAELFLDDKSLGTFPAIQQPVPLHQARNGHRVMARMADGSSREWTVPALNPKDKFTIDGATPP